MKIAIPMFDHRENYKIAVDRTAEKLGLPITGVFLDAADKDTFSVDDYAALLLPGGGDIDPMYYNEPVEGSEGIDRALDEFQFTILDAFVKACKPVFGICRGHQLLNVYFGGSLIQDIPERADHVPVNNDDNVHEVEADENSLLAILYGTRFAANSSHHQAVKVPGKGLHVTARGLDGVVESMEHDSLPIISTQFHPERMCYDKAREDTVDGSAIFAWFLHRVYAACTSGNQEGQPV